MEELLKLAAEQPALVPVVSTAVVGLAGFKVVEWGMTVTKLLGNHLRHDLADQTEAIKDLKFAIVGVQHAVEENTMVSRAMGRELVELRKDVNREPISR